MKLHTQRQIRRPTSKSDYLKIFGIDRDDLNSFQYIIVGSKESAMVRCEVEARMEEPGKMMHNGKLTRVV